MIGIVSKDSIRMLNPWCIYEQTNLLDLNSAGVHDHDMVGSVLVTQRLKRFAHSIIAQYSRILKKYQCTNCASQGPGGLGL